MLSPCTGQVAHALLTRPPLMHGASDRNLPSRTPVRLACVRHAASVHPEPGSNSHVHVCLNPFRTNFWQVFRLLLFQVPPLFVRVSLTANSSRFTVLGCPRPLPLHASGFRVRLFSESSFGPVTAFTGLTGCPSGLCLGLPRGIFRVALLFICQGSF